MKHSMLERVEVLEALAVPSRPVLLRCGWLANQLPADYTGERHYVAIGSSPTGNPNIEWCLFEERAGPAPESKRPNPR